MEPEESAVAVLQRRLRDSLSEQERTHFNELHKALARAVRTGGKNGDPLALRDAIVLMLARMQGHALDQAISLDHVLYLLEKQLARLEQDWDAATLDARLERMRRERLEHEQAQDDWLAVYQRSAVTLVMTVEGAREHYAQLKQPYDEMVRHATEAKQVKRVITQLTLERDKLASERRMVAAQRVLADAATEKHSALVAYMQYFDETNSEARLLKYVRRREQRDATHKESREEAPRSRKKPRADAHELVSDALCLYRQSQDRMVKFIARDDALLQLYEQLAGAATTAGGFVTIRRTERLDASQSDQWQLCPHMRQQGAILMEIDALQPLFASDGSLVTTKHADRFAVLYELVHYMQQAAQQLQGFQYNQRDVTRLMWQMRPQPRKYGQLSCVSKMGVVMLELSEARVQQSDPLYLESVDYALFTELARTLTLPNFTHKLLALLGDHKRLSYKEVLSALAVYWSERAFTT